MLVVFVYIFLAFLLFSTRPQQFYCTCFVAPNNCRTIITERTTTFRNTPTRSKNGGMLLFIRLLLFARAVVSVCLCVSVVVVIVVVVLTIVVEFNIHTHDRHDFDRKRRIFVSRCRVIFFPLLLLVFLLLLGVCRFSSERAL